MMTNPFTFGTRIQHPKKFVGRRVEREQIIARLNGTQPEGSAIVGERRIGKSSLLYYLVHPRDDETLLPLNTRRMIYLSAAAGYCNTPEQFRLTLIKTLLEQCKLDRRRTVDRRLHELQQELASEGSCSWGRAREVLENMPFHPVICLDEFEALLNDAFNDRFFNALRNWANEGLVSWVTSSAKPLQDILEHNNLTSPFFNLLATVPLGELTDSEANDLLAQADRTSHAFTESEKRMIKRLAGNHPYHLQIVAWRLWEMKEAGETVAEQALRDFLCQQPEPPAICKKLFRKIDYITFMLIVFILITIFAWFVLRQLPNLFVSENLAQVGGLAGLAPLMGLAIFLALIFGTGWMGRQLGEMKRNLWERR